MKNHILIGCYILLLSACAVGPDYARPSAPVPTHYKEASNATVNKEWKIAQPKDTHDRGAWWQVFNNPELNALQARVNVSNQNIASADAQYRQALALAGQARAAYSPVIDTGARQVRQKPSALDFLQVESTPRDDYSVSVSASWEPDLWGTVRRQVESKNAQAQASEAQLAAMRLSMQALLAQNYFKLRTLDATQRSLDEAASAYQKALQLTQDRLKSGVATASDVAQAQTQLKVAQAQAIDNGINRAQLEHAIAVLIGQPPASFSLPPKKITLQPPRIPPQIPSVLLERRPDISQREREVAAANAQIGVAKAAYFPVFSLSGTYGYDSNNFAHLFSQPTSFWSLGPKLAATLLDGGLRRAKTEAARASYDEKVANYRQTVLTAFQEVEDNLVALRSLSQEAKVQQQAVAAAQKSLTLALANYKAGLIAYTDVIIAQTAFYGAERGAVEIAGRRMVAAVGLVVALGG